MSAIPLKNQIIDWLKHQEYWFQYSGNRLLEGESVTDELAVATYKLFSEDWQLIEQTEERTEIVFNEIANAIVGEANNLKLRLINDIENVNALHQGQAIEINGNLTIVYGANGSGKSGYVRLLNNAFISRGDKNILQNVFVEGSTGEPKCNFVFQTTGEPYSKVFPTDRASSEFSQFAVFDTTCVRVRRGVIGLSRNTGGGAQRAWAGEYLGAGRVPASVAEAGGAVGQPAIRGARHAG